MNNYVKCKLECFVDGVDSSAMDYEFLVDCCAYDELIKDYTGAVNTCSALRVNCRECSDSSPEVMIISGDLLRISVLTISENKDD